MMSFNNWFARTIERVFASAPVPVQIRLWNGQKLNLSPTPTVAIFVPRASALRYFLPPNLSNLGEAFVDGHIRVEGSIHELFRVAEQLARNVAVTTRSGLQRLRRHTRKLDRTAIQYHYDVSNEFYSLFLDSNMVYSCAYYRHEQDSLEVAQTQKLDHILKKLKLKQNEQFLDIGCGWGSLIFRAAKQYGARATGITLSQNQYDYVRDRIQSEGLENRCNVQLCDYRDLSPTNTFDKIASVGMFEHVGLNHLSAYFTKINSLLKDDGLVLNHGITSSNTESREIGMGAGEFIDRYVFPGGELPHVALAIKEMADSGLEVVDVESLRRHYARTCREWVDRLEVNRSRAVSLAGERRFRIWEIYLAGCAYGFANSWINIYQMLACKSKNVTADPLPLTRDYMYR
jgi:cyclopropane-fatty-acyl-phospholipid synthase